MRILGLGAATSEGGALAQPVRGGALRPLGRGGLTIASRPGRELELLHIKFTGQEQPLRFVWVLHGNYDFIWISIRMFAGN